jgi:hypothetical protein
MKFNLIQFYFILFIPVPTKRVQSNLNPIDEEEGSESENSNEGVHAAG